MANVSEGKDIFPFKNDVEQNEEHQSKPIMISPFDKESDEQAICSDYWVARKAFKACKNIINIELPYVGFLYLVLKDMCRRQEVIRRCMYEQIKSCPIDDVLTIQSLVNASFSSCNGSDISSNVETYLKDRYRSLIHLRCETQVINQAHSDECDPSTRPVYKQNATLLEGAKYEEKSSEWSVNCLLNSTLDEYLPDCFMTRKNIYGIYVAAFPLTRALGVETNYLFEYFMSRASKYISDEYLFRHFTKRPRQHADLS